MEEQLISFETAKLAKEKGFTLLVPRAYIGGELRTNEVDESNADYSGYDHSVDLDDFDDNWNKEKWLFTKDFCECFGCNLDNKKYFEACSAPTQSLLQRWIRETRGVNIQIYNNASGYLFQMSKADSGTDLGWSEYEGPNNSGVWDTYEGALEAALKVQLALDLVQGAHWGLYVASAIKALKLIKIK